MTFEKTPFHLVLKWHRPGLTLWENAAMNDFESGWIRVSGRFRHNDKRQVVTKGISRLCKDCAKGVGASDKIAA
jgi:hypothetical protein